MRAKVLLPLVSVAALALGAIGFWSNTTEAQTADKRYEVIGQSLLVADAVDQCFYLAQAQVRVVSITEIHAVAGSDGSAVSLQITKASGTTAAGSGTDLLTNNTNVGFNMKGTAETLQTATIATTANLTLLNPGDRLCMDYDGVVTAVAGVTVSALLEQLL